MMKNERAPHDPSYEPDRLYTLFGRPNLGIGMLIVGAMIVAGCLLVLGITDLVF